MRLVEKVFGTKDDIRLAFALFKTMIVILFPCAVAIALPIKYLELDYIIAYILAIMVAIVLGIIFYWRFTVLRGNEKVKRILDERDLYYGKI